MKYLLTARHTLGSTFILCLLLSACQKNNDNNISRPPGTDTTAHLLKIIDWEAANSSKDSVPEYTIKYIGDSITALIGKYQDTITFRYEAVSGLRGTFYKYITNSRIIRTRNFPPHTPVGLDTCDFSQGDYRGVQGLSVAGLFPDYPYVTQFLYVTQSQADHPVDLHGGDRSGAFVSDIHVSYDTDGDITSMIRSTKYAENTFTDTITVIYTAARNRLKDVEKNISLIDPSCRNIENYLMAGRDPHVNTFPLSVHYGTKCVSSYKISSTDFYLDNPIDHNESVNNVSYESNTHGSITKILINNQPFKEFVYK